MGVSKIYGLRGSYARSYSLSMPAGGRSSASCKVHGSIGKAAGAVVQFASVMHVRHDLSRLETEGANRQTNLRCRNQLGCM